MDRSFKGGTVATAAMRSLAVGLCLVLAGCRANGVNRVSTAVDRPSALQAQTRPERHPGEARLVQYQSDEPSAASPAGAVTAGPGESPAPPEPLPSNTAERPICELNLTQALAAAAGRSPQVAFAAARYRQAYAQWEAARVLWLPSIRAGVSYNKHEGALQDVEGNVFDASRASMQSGLGVFSVGTGTPAIAGVVADFDLADAIYEPRIAGYAAAARRNALSAATQQLLLDVALAYLDLLEAMQQQAIARETADRAEELANLTSSFAETGEGLRADAERAMAELMLRRSAVAQTAEEVDVARARLVELLHMGPTTVVMPQETAIVPVELVDPQRAVGELLPVGLSNRPELAEAHNLVCEAVNRYRRERMSPLLPSALLATSYSAFGGGEGDTLDDFGDRFDLDAVTYWEIRNLGFGERAARRAARAELQQTESQQVMRMDQVAREVIQAHAEVQARRGQIALAERAVQSAGDSYRLNVERIRDGQGLPIEALQSLQALELAQREYLRTVVAYNEAQFRLQRAMGWPMQ
jgi:outer membrane protein TolC